MDADRDRTLRIEIPPCDVQKGPGELTWSDLSGISGWALLPTPGLELYWEGSIDLSGYARDYKTFYPQGGLVQRGAFMAEKGGEGSITYTVVSSTPLNPEEVVLQIFSAGGPGLLNLGSTGALGLATDQQNWTQIIFAESQINVPNVNISPNTIGIQQPLERNQTGSLSPTAAQVLYVMAVVVPFAGSNSTRMTIPASRVILPGTMDQEPELEYMQRLARSVQLANQV